MSLSWLWTAHAVPCPDIETNSQSVSVKTGLKCEHGQEYGEIEENHKSNTNLSD